MKKLFIITIALFAMQQTSAMQQGMSELNEKLNQTRQNRRSFDIFRNLFNDINLSVNTNGENGQTGDIFNDFLSQINLNGENEQARYNIPSDARIIFGTQLREINQLIRDINQNERVVIQRVHLERLLQMYGLIRNNPMVMLFMQMAPQESRINLPEVNDLRGIIFSNVVQNNLNRFNALTRQEQNQLIRNFQNLSPEEKNNQIAGLLNLTGEQLNALDQNLGRQEQNVHQIMTQLTPLLNGQATVDQNGSISNTPPPTPPSDNTRYGLYAAAVAAPIIAIIAYIWYTKEDQKDASSRKKDRARRAAQENKEIKENKKRRDRR